MKWVKLAKFCALSGETPASVHNKRRKGHYVDGVHTKIAEDGNLWVNTEAVEEWVEQGKTATQKRLRAA